MRKIVLSAVMFLVVIGIATANCGSCEPKGKMGAKGKKIECKAVAADMTMCLEKCGTACCKECPQCKTIKKVKKGDKKAMKQCAVQQCTDKKCKCECCADKKAKKVKKK